MLFDHLYCPISLGNLFDSKRHDTIITDLSSQQEKQREVVNKLQQQLQQLQAKIAGKSWGAVRRLPWFLSFRRITWMKTFRPFIVSQILQVFFEYN